MIFSHTAGFVGVNDPAWLNDTDCFDRYACHARYDPNSTTTLEECVRQIAAHPLAAPPEREWIYSDWGYDIVALIVQAATGARFEDAFQRAVAAPLGMRGSTYECDAPGSTADDPHLATGLCTTTADMGKLTRMLLRRGLAGGDGDGGDDDDDANATRVLSRSAVAQIFSHQTGDATLTGDAPFFDANLGGGRCANSATQAASNLGYGFGATHHLGFKSEAWVHGSHLGANFFVAPNRFAFYVGAVYPNGSTAVLARCLRAIDAFERENRWLFRGPDAPALGDANMTMCPTSLELAGNPLDYGVFHGPVAQFGPDGRLANPYC